MHVFPRHGHVRLTGNAAADIRAVLAPIWTEKAIPAKRERQRIGMVMQCGIAPDWRTGVPADRVPQPFPSSR